jgi:methyl-accepting chemotaxis protein
MALTVAQVAENTSHVSRSASVAASAARHGDETVAMASEKMQEISQRSVTAAASLEELARNSADIGKAVSLIEDIAAQTNLLALNANIEAAPASMARDFPWWPQKSGGWLSARPVPLAKSTE